VRTRPVPVNLHMVKMFHGASSGLGGPPLTMILLAKRARWCCVGVAWDLDSQLWGPQFTLVFVPAIRLSRMVCQAQRGWRCAGVLQVKRIARRAEVMKHQSLRKGLVTWAFVKCVRACAAWLSGYCKKSSQALHHRSMHLIVVRLFFSPMHLLSALYSYFV